MIYDSNIFYKREKENWVNACFTLPRRFVITPTIWISWWISGDSGSVQAGRTDFQFTE